MIRVDVNLCLAYSEELDENRIEMLARYKKMQRNRMRASMVMGGLVSQSHLNAAIQDVSRSKGLDFDTSASVVESQLNEPVDESVLRQ